MIGPGVRVAVTGASGFCGGFVARAAARAGAGVICVGRRPGPVGTHRSWDATAGVPDLRGADVVVHLAAAVGDAGPERVFRAVNVDGTRRLLDAAGGRLVVWVSSGSVYGPAAGPVTEEHPVTGGRSAYGRTKAEGERLALAAGAVVLRPRAVYGRGDPYLLPRLAGAVRGGMLRLPGPDTVMSLTAVENLADACLRSAGSWPPGAYNVADDHPYPRNETVRRVLAAAGAGPVRIREVPVVAALAAATVFGPLTARIPSRYAVEQLAHGLVLDTGKARRQGWRPRHTLDGFLSGRG